MNKIIERELTAVGISKAALMEKGLELTIRKWEIRKANLDSLHCGFQDDAYEALRDLDFTLEAIEEEIARLTKREQAILQWGVDHEKTK